MKKIVAILLTVVMVCLALTACSETAPEASPAASIVPAPAASSASAASSSPAASNESESITSSPKSTTADTKPTPAAIGTEVKFKNVSGSGTFTGAMKVVEVIRGKDAWDKIIASYANNPKPSEGYEFAVVKVRVTIDSIEKNVNDKDEGVCLYNVAFKSFTGDYKEISDNSYASTPKPAWVNSTLLKVGDTKEANMVFVVKKDDPSPKMGFNVEYDGTGYWFALTK